MDKIKKALKKLTAKEREQIKNILVKLDQGDLKGLDIKKLKGREDIYRVRKGSLRMIFRQDNQKIFLLTIERRSGKTYR
jgi:mRNA-degrading endonuclease RelE of RelBE toxin-antitoxin system